MEGIKIVPRPPKKKIKIRREVFDDFDLKLKQQGKIAEKEVFPISVPKKTFRPEPKLEKTQTLPRYEGDLFKESPKEKVKEKIIIKKVPRRKILSVQNVLLTFGTVCILFFLIISATRTYSNAQAAKDNAFSEAINANSHLQNALLHLEKSDFKKAQENFQKAEYAFLEAQKEIDDIGVVSKQAVKLTPHYGELVKNGENTVEGGYHLCRAAQNLLKFAEPFLSDGPSNFIPDNYQTEFDFSQSLTQKLTENQKYFKEGLKEIKRSNNNFEGITETGIPEDFREQIFAIRDKLPQIEEGFEGIDDNFSLLLDALGHNETRQYLILFQNNSEMRATGGFIGSYAILKIHKGKVRKFFVDNIYNPDGIAPLDMRIEAPAPFQKFMEVKWIKMRDANWSPDFPTAAQKVAWLYEKEGGSTVDGVIAITPTLIEDLLKITGPVKIDKQYKTDTLTSDNFRHRTQIQVDKYSKNTKNPKKFLADFAPKLLNKMVHKKENWPNLLNTFTKSIREKNFLAYFFKPQEEKIAKQYKINGEITTTPDKTDYLSVINSNLGADKTSSAIKETIRSNTRIHNDGRIIRTVTIQRKHLKTKLFGGSERNIDYMRIITPKGSQLIEAKGNKYKIDILSEKDKTAFGTTMITERGKTSKLILKYHLPFKIKPHLFDPDKEYQLYFQKQSGSFGSKVLVNIEVEDSLGIEAKTTPLNKTESRVGYKFVLKTDRQINSIIKK